MKYNSVYWKTIKVGFVLCIGFEQQQANTVKVCTNTWTHEMNILLLFFLLWNSFLIHKPKEILSFFQHEMIFSLNLFSYKIDWKLLCI